MVEEEDMLERDTRAGAKQRDADLVTLQTKRDEEPRSEARSITKAVCET